MTIHRYHPDHDRGDAPRGVAVLWDDCERCDEHAANPGIGLDADRLRALAVMGTPATVNDAKAIRAIRDAIHLAAKVAMASDLLDP